MPATTGQRVGLSTAVFVLSQAGMAAYHEGAIGLIVGCGLTYATWKFADELFERRGGEPSPLALPASSKARGLAYRLLTSRAQRRAEAALAEQEREEQEDDRDVLQAGRPSTFTFSSLMSDGWRPSREQVYLAMLEDGTHVMVPLHDLVHIALAGSTRQGKTSIIRQLLSQVLSIGCDCVLLDPHYTPYDVESNEDWTPFTPHLVERMRADPMECKEYNRIEQVLQWASTTLLEKRKARRSASKHPGNDLFFFIDEYPAIIAERKSVQKYVSKLLREGGKYRIHLVIASQDFQVRTVFADVGGAIRDQFDTCLYVGGDKTTVREILETDVREIPESQLGKGLVVVRAPTCKKARPGFTPWMDNEAIYSLVGPSTYEPTEEVEPEEAEAAAPSLRTVPTLRHSAAQQSSQSELLPSEHRSERAQVPTPIVPEKGRRAEEIDLSIAVQVWNGMLPSVRQMEAIFDLNNHQARRLRDRILRQADARKPEQQEAE
ncbi:MAG: hypothetical protein JO202_19425 [Ktedonobacteraceae bacterium]|nr:hypothetical protein [Ktedonobacteraceae bacterium]